LCLPELSPLYLGSVLSIPEKMNKVRVPLVAGGIFQALISYEALLALDLAFGDLVRIHSKPHSGIVF
jgi:hypothetical protein